ncbi:MAG: glutathione S-transferase [Candidatus Azotimanducaceae bacterium]|jgi:glutathione S-transferase
MEHPFADQTRIKRLAGAAQVPMIERDDGRWVSERTPILLHLEKEQPTPGILPSNPVVRLIALLIEDYADEWLWRAAMHYRWSYDHDRALLSRILADETTKHLKIPRFMRRRMIEKRQFSRFFQNDGVTKATRAHVESGYRLALSNMALMLANRPDILGNAPFYC